MTANRQTASQVDRVFNHFAKGQNDQYQRKKRRIEPKPDPQGGFIIDDTPGPGGFILEESEPELAAVSEPESDSTDQNDRILLSDIPDALQLLDLPPDDPEVLSVFRNAASGWSNQLPGESHDRGVTRADFRSVCLVLLGAEDVQEDATPGISEESEADASDAYRQSSATPLSDSEMELDNGDDGDFTPDSGQRLNAKRRKRGKVSEPYDFTSTRPITARQKEVCFAAFQLFFPSVKAEELPHQKIFLKDLVRVADSIKERIKSDDMLEMLTEFSTSPDKSMNLEDFERMMIAAKLT